MQQQIDLSMRGLSKDFQSFSPFHMSCAPVSVAKPSGDSKMGSDSDGSKARKGMNLEEFYATRESQMREASVLKYGDQVQGVSKFHYYVSSFLLKMASDGVLFYSQCKFLSKLFMARTYIGAQSMWLITYCLLYTPIYSRTDIFGNLA